MSYLGRYMDHITNVLHLSEAANRFASASEHLAVGSEAQQAASKAAMACAEEAVSLIQEHRESISADQPKETP